MKNGIMCELHEVLMEIKMLGRLNMSSKNTLRNECQEIFL